MAYFKTNIQTTGDFFIYHYGTDLNTLISSVYDLLKANGYKISEGGGVNAVVEKGNRVLRILFGAFVKYFKFVVQLKEIDSETAELKIIKHSSGISGGLIGMNQVKKELKRLGEVMMKI